MRSRELGRLATLAVIPAMVMAIVWARGASESPPQLEQPPPAGSILVGRLRQPGLVAVDVTDGSQRMVVLPGAAHELLRFGDRVYVTLARSDLVAEVQLPSLALLRSVSLPGQPHGLAWWSERLAVSLDGEDDVVALDPGTLAERGRWRVGGTPHALAATDQGLFVAEARSGTLRRLGAGVIAAPGGMPESIAAVDGVIVAALTEAGALAFVDSSGRHRVVPVGSRPVRVLDAGPGLVAVALGGSGQVALYRAGDAQLLWRTTVGRLPDGLCRSPDGRYLAVSATGDDRVAILDLASGAVVRQFTVQGGPGACLWLDG
jgi:DNA-binding beta-propeller fold protein YncE